MKGIYVSYATLLVAIGQILVAIGNKDSEAFYAAATAVLACFLPAVFHWLTPPAPPVPPAV